MTILMMTNIFKSFFGYRGKESTFNIFPVNNFPYLLYIIQTNILIVNIIGVLPNINCCMKYNIQRSGVCPAGAVIS